MNLLFFTSMRGSPWGGSEELWAAAAEHAIQAGHKVAISAFAWEPTPPRIAELARRGAKLIPRPLHVGRIRAWLSSPSWLAELDSFEPDAVCLSQGAAHECVGRRGTRPLLAWLERTRTPLVNIVQFNHPGELRASTADRSRRLMNLALVNGFVAARNIAEAAQSLKIEIPRAQVVRNPVNLRETSPLPWPGNGTPRFGCVGRLHVDAKGQDLLLDALADRPWRDKPWSLSLFGAGQDETRLRDQARKVGLESRVQFRGQSADIRAIWAEHHLLLLPSRAEGTPLAMVEAMLLGRPALVTDVGGCAEWVRESTDGNGYIARLPTVQSLGQTLDRAWAERAIWPQVGARARETALKLHDPDPGRTLLGMLESAPKRG